MLTPTQTLAAADLLKQRPAVIPGTRAIINDEARWQFYTRVSDVMEALNVEGQEAVNEFCDLAGIAD
jgi:hypothetical protein